MLRLLFLLSFLSALIVPASGQAWQCYNWTPEDNANGGGSNDVAVEQAVCMSHNSPTEQFYFAHGDGTCGGCWCCNRPAPPTTATPETNLPQTTPVPTTPVPTTPVPTTPVPTTPVPTTSAPVSCAWDGVYHDFDGPDVGQGYYGGTTEEEKDASCCQFCKQYFPTHEYWVRSTTESYCWCKNGFSGFSQIPIAAETFVMH